MALTLIRHTRVAAPEGLCYGRHDVALAQPPEPPFEAVAAAIAQPVAGVVASPASRTAALGRWLAARWGVALALDARWQELDFGAWEGRRWADIPRAESETWCADIERAATPGGESRLALRARVDAALAELHARCRDAHWVVVTHAGPIRVALGAPLTLALPWGSAHTLRALDGGWSGPP